jgi:endonuclease YncB( thermonuclease family)
LQVVLLRNNIDMFAFRGNRKTFRADALSVFFVLGVTVLGLVSGCSEGRSADNNTTPLLPKSSSNPSPQTPSIRQHSAQHSAQHSTDCALFAKTERVRVAKIYDGDTLTLSDGRKVRLVGVNTTEMGRDGQPDQPLARRAQQVASRFVRQSDRVELLLDTQSKDHYGRWLGHIYNDEGQNLEQHLLQQGLAYHVAIPPNLTLAECLAKAEQQGRDAQLGVWGDQGPLPVKAKHIKQGGFQRVQGQVTAINIGKHWQLELDKNISVMIYVEHQHRFTRAWFQRLQDKNIEVQGWVYQSRDEWRIKLETPYGIELL